MSDVVDFILFILFYCSCVSIVDCEQDAGWSNSDDKYITHILFVN